MKIPLGYGDCRIQIKYGYDSSTNTYEEKNFYFHHLDSIVEPVPQLVQYTDINYNNVQRVFGYHLHFNLKFVDKNTSNGNQDTLSEFMAYFYDNVFIDGGDDGAVVLGHRVYLDLFNGNVAGVNDYQAGKLWVLAQLPKMHDISQGSIFGQWIELNAVSEKCLTVDQMRDFYSAYRDGSSWGNVDPVALPVFGFSNENIKEVSTSVYGER